MDRPPLGIMPPEIWKGKRMEELSHVIHEHIKAGYIPKTLIWIEELHKLVEEEFVESEKKNAFLQGVKKCLKTESNS